jgi:hypothetical protein
MKTGLYMAVLATMLAAAGAAAAEPFVPQTIEEGLESDTSMVLLPSSVYGTLTFLACTTCAAAPLRLTPATQFFIGAKAATLTAVSRLMGPSNPTAMVIFFKPGTSNVTRIVVSASQ